MKLEILEHMPMDYKNYKQKKMWMILVVINDYFECLDCQSSAYLVIGRLHYDYLAKDLLFLHSERQKYYHHTLFVNPRHLNC